MPIKAVFFDFMGTCLDWHSAVLKAFPPSIPPDRASSLALQWRQQYFHLNSARVKQNLPIEHFDSTLAKALDVVLTNTFHDLDAQFDSSSRQRAVQAFHNQTAWPDVAPALQSLRDRGLEIFVHANGSTRLQLDLTTSAKLSFNMLFSSELLGVYMPAPEAHHKVLKLIGAKPEEVVKVAAHAWDIRGAKDVGMKTVYVRRWTDDIEEEMEVFKGEFNAFLESMEGLAEVVEKMC
ncbi:HAD-like protein [Massarina eburnea CBS 473.64]|uniref:HAD-like protein n=1 Tax=Massarina eburnea CBS 473.64 TaxID=1395130 RepID=A0A6A6RH24_9PLEO|nr:HAD-like protein [Massarina eburnea CBS 473.64]